MSVPPDIRPPQLPNASGIVVGIIPSSDRTCDIEVYRQFSTASSYDLHERVSAQSISGRKVNVLIYAPLDGRTLNVKARSVAKGRSASTYSTVLSAKARMLPANLGELPLAQSQTRVISATPFHSNTSTGFTNTGNFITSASAGALTGGNVYADAGYFPAGTIITRIRTRTFMKSSTGGDIVNTTLRYSTGSGNTNVFTANALSTGDVTQTSTGPRHIVGTGRSYHVLALLRNWSTVGSSRLYRVEIDYVPHL